LAAIGGSSGGLLTAVMMTKHPTTFKAIVAQVPVLDLFRYDLLNGNAAVSFGFPEIARDREVMAATSPYQNLRAGDKYPTPLIMPTANDPAVLAAGPRRFTAKLAALGHPYYFYEAPDGGHGSWATPQQHAMHNAILYSFLYSQIMSQ
jgi:prolyl oligopeptidase